ncbi:hypothetical protein EJB05_55783 [Eragrostis curvula]|uniref:Uncharacterized protein n=1 Tax=Eragrostis curvula TaxID=38414 RepID=A0A5J9SHX0_9POAL|nr:hypothetical protein EJB05_55783 [Eragrostis curvula]
MAATAASGGFINDAPILHAENLISNVKSINYSRTFLSIISGVVAGIWGFTGLMGFVFYFLVMMVGSLGLLVKAKFAVHSYFDSWSRILIEGVLGGLMLFSRFSRQGKEAELRFRSKGERIAFRFGHLPGSFAKREKRAFQEARRRGSGWASAMVREEKLDLVLVPLGVMALAVYHLWLLYTILRHPTRTVIGVNGMARKRWNTEKNGVLAVQTLRNNMMASTVLATTAITLVSVISVFIGVTSPSSAAPLRLVYGSKSGDVFAAKYLAVSLCFMLAFVCNVQAIRLYAHASFLLGGLPPGEGAAAGEEFAAYVARTVNRGSHAWSLGLRAFYVSLALFLWTFGPIPMLVCSVLMCGLLYFLDTTSEHAHAHGTAAGLHGHGQGAGEKDATV